MITNKNRKYVLVGIIAFSVLFTSFSYYLYQSFYTPNILVEGEEPAYLKIPKGATFSQVSDSLSRNNLVNNMISFSFVAKLLGYQENVKPGRYEIEPRMTNTQLVRALRSGRQSPLNLTFNNIRTKEELAEKISKSLALSSKSFYALLT